MKTIYSEVHELIESGYGKFICNAVNYESTFGTDSVESRVILQEVQLALTTTDGETQGSVEALLCATAYKDVEIVYEELKGLAKSWRLDWLQRKHENATIKYTHEKYLPTEVRAKRRHIETLVRVKHELETSTDSAPWVCGILDNLKFCKKADEIEEIRLLVEQCLKGKLFISSVGALKGATPDSAQEKLLLHFNDAPTLTATQYRIGWIDWLIHNTED